MFLHHSPVPVDAQTSLTPWRQFHLLLARGWLGYTLFPGAYAAFFSLAYNYPLINGASC